MHALPHPSSSAPGAALNGRVALVTGASRGAGRAIAAVLGVAGATVFVTGRSVRGKPTTQGMPEVIEETAEEVTRRGGTGIPVRCDHTADAEVERLFDRIRGEHGSLDLVVSNAWGGYEAYGDDFDAPFWEQPLSRWDAMFTAGVRSHLLTSCLAAPLMLEPRPDGHPRLILTTVAWAFGGFLGNVIYDAAKAAIVRTAYTMSRELRTHNVAAIALAPGWMRTERVIAAQREQGFELDGSESPEYLGRAVGALAADKGVMGKAGQVLAVGDLAREYGFSDIDGRQPAAFRIPDET